MRRTQILIPDELHRRAAGAARSRGVSLGHLVREALTQYLEHADRTIPDPEAIDRILLAEPFHDPDPDPFLSVDHDYYLYGAKRKSQSSR